MSELRTGGQKVSETGYSGLGAILGGIAGIAIFMLTIGTIALDIALGPQFLFAQAEANQVDLGFWGKVVPWIFSIATTGLLYALWERPKGGKEDRIIRFAAYGITLADTLVDIGGFNAFFYDDPSVGEHIFLPPGAPKEYIFFNIVVGLVCLFHEPVLTRVLGRYQHKVNLNGADNFGDKFEAGLVYLSGLVLNVIKAISVVVGALAMFALDLVLMPQMGTTPTAKTGLIVVSLLVWALQVALWRFYVHTRQRSSLKELGRAAQLLFLATLLFSLVDTYFDMRGYNEMITGYDSFLPPDRSPAWLLVFAMIAVMCTLNEPLTNEIFRPLGRKKQEDINDMFGDIA